MSKIAQLTAGRTEEGMSVFKRERGAAQYHPMSLMDASEKMTCLFLAGGYTVSMSPAELWIVYHF